MDTSSYEAFAAKKSAYEEAFIDYLSAAEKLAEMHKWRIDVSYAQDYLKANCLVFKSKDDIPAIDLSRLRAAQHILVEHTGYLRSTTDIVECIDAFNDELKKRRSDEKTEFMRFVEVYEQTFPDSLDVCADAFSNGKDYRINLRKMREMLTSYMPDPESDDRRKHYLWQICKADKDVVLSPRILEMSFIAMKDSIVDDILIAKARQKTP